MLVLWFKYTNGAMSGQCSSNTEIGPYVGIVVQVQTNVAIVLNDSSLGWNRWLLPEVTPTTSRFYNSLLWLHTLNACPVLLLELPVYTFISNRAQQWPVEMNYVSFRIKRHLGCIQRPSWEWYNLSPLSLIDKVVTGMFMNMVSRTHIFKCLSVPTTMTKIWSHCGDIFLNVDPRYGYSWSPPLMGTNLNWPLDTSLWPVTQFTPGINRELESYFNSHPANEPYLTLYRVDTRIILSTSDVFHGAGHQIEFAQVLVCINFRNGDGDVLLSRVFLNWCFKTRGEFPKSGTAFR